ncbi:hypothetical protein AMK16_20030 [Streptomyces sp. CB00455]|uniref:hypothetical protein n=1 Tax=Streptomyces sp. CB00455 TaxID=1703927 RepID=UPI000938B01B|nr:hypothetical protein [Streptomyces sp. CB00455]OKK17196.1 hypothetical protein AMK16_20030 [Streptomyces sp. CB00455]
MFTSPWQRPLILAAASLAFLTGTGCAAHASQTQAPAGSSSSVLAGQSAHCGGGGRGGEGGAGGKGGAPGEPGRPGKPGRPGCFRFDDLPDKPKKELGVTDKVRIVLTVLTDDSDATKKRITEKYKISQDQLETWKQDYLDGNWFALMEGSSPSCR